MVRRIEHIAIAVKDVEASARLFETLLGIDRGRIETLPDEGAKVAFFELEGSRIELVQGIGSNNPMSKFIERRGEGLHHICLEVDDLPGTLSVLHAAGIPLIDRVPKSGSSGTRVAFLHPKGCNGVLVELVEQPSGA
ncbi:methylmalonyl-CoA epimerase [Candidatus Methylomirabilis sp.]|uniref:Methylmalonyl-CoA epimerase n=1 Tax=Candidatus Methylomirabilis tolerans TaxID=3123416 RepID=A0AAJ1AH02_9BACT|nr:methylmalonyl-CoA epimerase [Candidatus Methylomirabilis sp.]